MSHNIKPPENGGFLTVQNSFFMYCNSANLNRRFHMGNDNDQDNRPTQPEGDEQGSQDQQ